MGLGFLNYTPSDSTVLGCSSPSSSSHHHQADKNLLFRSVARPSFSSGGVYLWIQYCCCTLVSSIWCMCPNHLSLCDLMYFSLQDIQDFCVGLDASVLVVYPNVHVSGSSSRCYMYWWSTRYNHTHSNISWNLLLVTLATSPTPFCEVSSIDDSIHILVDIQLILWERNWFSLISC